eukprot:m51a1_g4238 hypothetical protein (505) ;mRNA; f:150598-152399
MWQSSHAHKAAPAAPAPGRLDESASRVIRTMRELNEKLCTTAVIHELEGSPVLSMDRELGTSWNNHHDIEAAVTARSTRPGSASEDQGDHERDAEAVSPDTDPSYDDQMLVALRNSTREICQILFMRGTLRDALAGISSEPTLSATFKVFLELVGELATMTEERLMSTVSSDAERRKELEAALSSSDKADEMLRDKQKALTEAKAAHARDLEQNGAAITRLREEIAENEAKVRETNMARAFKDAEAAFKTEKEKLEAQLDSKGRENKRKEQALRKRKQRVEQEAAAWFGKFDHDMGDLDQDFRAVGTDHEKEREELLKVEASTAELTKIRDELEAEEQKRTQKLAREAEKRRQMEDAAKRIQRCWHNYRTRKEAIKKSRSLKKLRPPGSSGAGSATDGGKKKGAKGKKGGRASADPAGPAMASVVLTASPSLSRAASRGGTPANQDRGEGSRGVTADGKLPEIAPPQTPPKTGEKRPSSTGSTTLPAIRDARSGSASRGATPAQ